VNTNENMNIMEGKDLAQLLYDGQSVFLTGSSGTGKTHLTKAALDYLQHHMGGCLIIRCGTTGVSALHHQNGMTLHSVFKLPVSDYPKTLTKWVERVRARMRKAEGILSAIMTTPRVVVLIDEISMLSAYLEELLDIECRELRRGLGLEKQPFGGITFLMVGDFMQLPPVYNFNDKNQPSRCALFAFESPCWKSLRLKTVVLTRNHRQIDAMFSSMICQLKDGLGLTESQRSMLRTKNVEKTPVDALCVMIRRDDVNKYNKQKLDDLETVLHEITFPSKLYYGANSKDLSYNLHRDVEQNLYLKYGESVQTFKTGCKVMIITNLSQFGYVNGDRGKIIGWSKRVTQTMSHFIGEMNESDECPVVLFERTKQKMLVCYHSFERELEFSDTPQFASLECIPLCIAEASTVHKLQGCSVTSPLHIVCDGMSQMSATFYVALSRATDFENVSFERFTNEGQVSKKALEFYKGTYVQPLINAKIAELLDKAIEMSTEEETRGMLDDGYKKAKNKRKFMDEVHRWVDVNK